MGQLSQPHLLPVSCYSTAAPLSLLATSYVLLFNFVLIEIRELKVYLGC